MRHCFSGLQSIDLGWRDQVEPSGVLYERAEFLVPLGRARCCSCECRQWTPPLSTRETPASYLQAPQRTPFGHF